MKLIKSKKGMSLIEIIISLAILGLVSTGIIGFFTDSFKFQARIQEVSKAQKFADTIIEDIKNGVRLYVDGYEAEEGVYKFKVSKIASVTSTPSSVPIKSGDNIVGGIELYDVTVTAWHTKNESIKGEASTTIREKKAQVDNKYEIVYWNDYAQSSHLFREEFYGEGDYNINPFVPGDNFKGWKYDGVIYGYQDLDDSNNVIEINGTTAFLIDLFPEY